jgi:Na+-transporting NADH:ubiquinone oxidoreductase subunit NqrC
MPLTTIYGGSPPTRIIGDANAIEQTLHIDTMRYINRLATASTPYSMNANEIDAINNLIWSCEAAGIWTKMQVVYPFIGSNQVVQSYNLKNVTTFQITWTGSAFTFSSANGFQKNAQDVTSYGTTGYIANTHATLNDSHISCYLGTQQLTGVSNIIVPVGGIGASIWYAIFSGLGTSSAGAGIQGVGVSNGIANFTPTTNNVGFILGSRTSSTSLKSFYNSNLVSTTTGSSSGRATTNTTIGVGNWSPVNYPCTQAIRFISFGTGLNDAESKAFSTIVQAYQTKLGRQV